MVDFTSKPVASSFYAEAAALGVTDFRWSGGQGGLYIDPALSPPIDPAQLALIGQAFTAHNPTSLVNSTAAQQAAVDDLCAQKLTAGYSDTVTGEVFQADDVSRANFTGVATACVAAIVASSPVTFDLIPLSNVTMTGLSAVQALAILNRMFAWVSATVIYARALKNEILAGETPDITAGWPS